jgi:23S rRNA pseudouridine1911/1915/1917 synthase
MQPLSSRIIHEENDFLILDKPAHLLMHPTKPGGPPTLWSELCELLAFEIRNGGQVSLINRLDRETSGLVMVAKNAQTARELARLVNQHRVEKLYAAITQGWPDVDRFEVDQPLLRQGERIPSKIWLKQAIHPAGYQAKTTFQVVQRFENAGAVLRSSAVSPSQGELIKSGFIWRRSVSPWLVTRSMAPTRTAIWNS